jgi:hypothetical protein
MQAIGGPTCKRSVPIKSVSSGKVSSGEGQPSPVGDERAEKTSMAAELVAKVAEDSAEVEGRATMDMAQKKISEETER